MWELGGGRLDRFCNAISRNFLALHSRGSSRADFGLDNRSWQNDEKTLTAVSMTVP